MNLNVILCYKCIWGITKIFILHFMLNHLSTGQMKFSLKITSFEAKDHFEVSFLIKIFLINRYLNSILSLTNFRYHNKIFETVLLHVYHLPLTPYWT